MVAPSWAGVIYPLSGRPTDLGRRDAEDDDRCLAAARRLLNLCTFLDNLFLWTYSIVAAADKAAR